MVSIVAWLLFSSKFFHFLRILDMFMCLFVFFLFFSIPSRIVSIWPFSRTKRNHFENRERDEKSNQTTVYIWFGPYDWNALWKLNNEHRHSSIQFSVGFETVLWHSILIYSRSRNNSHRNVKLSKHFHAFPFFSCVLRIPSIAIVYGKLISSVEFVIILNLANLFYLFAVR